MKTVIVRLISGAALHHPQRFVVTSQDSSVGEMGRAQTHDKAKRLQQGLELLERSERGELVERDEAGLQAASD